MAKHNGEMVKRFVAPTMRRALEMVSDELGPEAVILSSQKTARGVEVVVSLEPDYATRGVEARREFGRNFDAELDAPMHSDAAWRLQAGMDKAATTYGATLNTADNYPVDKQRSREDLVREIEAARQKMLAAKRAAKQTEEPIGLRRAEGVQPANTTNASNATNTGKAGENPMNRQIEELYSMNSGMANNTAAYDEDKRLQELHTEIADMRLLLEQQLWRMNDQPQQINMPQQVNFKAGTSPLSAHFERLGLHTKLAEELKDSVIAETRPSVAWRNAMAILSRRIPVLEKDITARGGVFAFVGPTGVGKTTTIAKLAARFVLQHGAGKVAIVTTDTFRVGAHDQLRSLGRILGVPVRIADKEHSLVSILASLKKFPLILVDTAGYRHGDPMLKQQLRQLDTCPFMKRVLVLACNSQYQNLKASVHAYSSQRKVDACVLSKLDETSSLGEALSVITQEQLPLAYMTDGQQIPADIHLASGHGLVAKAVGMLKQQQLDQHAAAF